MIGHGIHILDSLPVRSEEVNSYINWISRLIDILSEMEETKIKSMKYTNLLTY